MLYLVFLLLIAVNIVYLAYFLVRKAQHPEMKYKKLFPIVTVIVALAAGAGVSMFYTQEVGTVTIVKSWSGKVSGSTPDAGFHVKKPWESTITYDTRNMIINFYSKAGDYSYNGGSASGPSVSINDKSGARAEVDIQVVYSLDPAAAVNLYTEYGTQTNYTQTYLSNDLRSVARETGGKFDTITMLTDRGQYANAVEKALTEKWKDKGLNIETVSVQDVIYDEAITQKYSEAQAAEIAKAQALNEQETAKVEAETKKITAQGEADANAILNGSLTDQVISQAYIEALKEIGKQGNLIVVPEGTSPILNTTKDK